MWQVESAVEEKQSATNDDMTSCSYLFWVIQGTMVGGLYRLDLHDISNGVKHEVRPDIILEDPNLGAFTVDHTNFRLLVPNHSQNTVVSVSLDGWVLVSCAESTGHVHYFFFQTNVVVISINWFHPYGHVCWKCGYANYSSIYLRTCFCTLIFPIAISSNTYNISGSG